MIFESELDAVQREVATRKRRRKFWALILFGLQGVFFLVRLSLIGHFHGHWGPFRELLETFINIVSFCSIVVTVAIFLRVSHPKSAAARLARLDDIRATGALASTLDYVGGQTLDTVVEALTRLLSRLRPQDGALLDRGAWQSLYRVLRPEFVDKAAKRPIDIAGFRIAILTAIETLGDRTALPVVERLAIHGPNSPEEASIHNRAQRCLEALKARLDRQQDRRTLLRPAYEQTALVSLLRPTSDPSSDEERDLPMGRDGQGSA